MSDAPAGGERAALAALAALAESDEPSEAELAQLLAEQRAVAAMVRAAALAQRAPVALRTAVERSIRK